MGISRQLWNIGDKIKEVDDFMTPERQATIKEAHPELIFLRLNENIHLEGRSRRSAAISASSCWLTEASSKFPNGSLNVTGQGLDVTI